MTMAIQTPMQMLVQFAITVAPLWLLIIYIQLGSYLNEKENKMWLGMFIVIAIIIWCASLSLSYSIVTFECGNCTMG